MTTTSRAVCLNRISMVQTIWGAHPSVFPPLYWCHHPDLLNPVDGSAGPPRRWYGSPCGPSGLLWEAKDKAAPADPLLSEKAVTGVRLTKEEWERRQLDTYPR